MSSIGVTLQGKSMDLRVRRPVCVTWGEHFHLSERLGFLASQSDCRNICDTYNDMIMYVKPFTQTGAENKNRACCALSFALQAGPPSPPREAPGLLCSLASTWVCSVETLAKDRCLKEERGDRSLLPCLPPSLWGRVTMCSSTQGHSPLPATTQLSPLLPLTLSGQQWPGLPALLVPGCPSTPSLTLPIP